MRAGSSTWHSPRAEGKVASAKDEGAARSLHEEHPFGSKVGSTPGPWSSTQRHGRGEGEDVTPEDNMLDLC